MKLDNSFFLKISVRPNISENWIVCAYDLFSREGPDGIQVERLARILKLNKSGFYHYFGNLDNFCDHLINYHHKRVDILLSEVAACKNIDPDYLNVLVKHSITIMAQIHLVRNKTHHRFPNVYKVVDEKIARALLLLWMDYTQIDRNSDLAYRYYCLVRDMTYTRIERMNFTVEHIRGLMEESKAMVSQILQEFRGSARRQLKPEPLKRVAL